MKSISWAGLPELSHGLGWPILNFDYSKCEERGGCVVECLARLRGCRFEPHWRHCIVSLSKTSYPLHSTGSTQEDLSQHDWKNVDWDVKNQNKHHSKCHQA